jgi:hypothetical protein
MPSLINWYNLKYSNVNLKIRFGFSLFFHIILLLLGLIIITKLMQVETEFVQDGSVQD